MPDAQEVEILSSKLHHLLGDLTIQEANATVRRCRGENGMLAWKRLTAIHNPKTLASGLKALMAVHNPPKICDIKKADIQIEEWETKMESLAIEYSEHVSGKVKLAVLYGMLPQAIQERMLDKSRTQWGHINDDEVARTFRAIVDEAKDIAKSRREQCVPSPMDISEVHQEALNPSGGSLEDEWDEWQDYNVNAIWYGASKGKGKSKGKSKVCFNCGNAGHFQRECPKGKGKSKAKGQWQSQMLGVGKGGGGAPRACFSCGSLEHLASACPNRPVHSVQAVDGDGSTPEVLILAMSFLHAKPQHLKSRNASPVTSGLQKWGVS